MDGIFGMNFVSIFYLETICRFVKDRLQEIRFKKRGRQTD